MNKNVGDVVYIREQGVNYIFESSFLYACELSHLVKDYEEKDVMVDDTFIVLARKYRGEFPNIKLVIKSLVDQRVYVVDESDVFESRSCNLVQEEAIKNLKTLVYYLVDLATSLTEEHIEGLSESNKQLIKDYWNNLPNVVELRKYLESGIL